MERYLFDQELRGHSPLFAAALIQTVMCALIYFLDEHLRSLGEAGGFGTSANLKRFIFPFYCRFSGSSDRPILVVF